MMLCHQLSRLFHPIIRNTSSFEDLLGKRQYVAHEVVASPEVEPSTSVPSPSELQVEHSYFAVPESPTKKVKKLESTVEKIWKKTSCLTANSVKAKEKNSQSQRSG